MLVDPSERFNKLQDTINTYVDSKIKQGWQIRAGGFFFINPEVLCPWCKKTVPNNRHLLVDEYNSKLVAQWKLNGKVVPKNPPLTYHPHTPKADGTLCYKRATSANQLLFTAINPIYRIHEWLWDIGHDCEKFMRATCISCKKYVPNFTLTFQLWGHMLCSNECVTETAKLKCRRCLCIRADSPQYSERYHTEWCSDCSKNMSKGGGMDYTPYDTFAIPGAMRWINNDPAPVAPVEVMEDPIPLLFDDDDDGPEEDLDD